jgi:hypothetical protein
MTYYKKKTGHTYALSPTDFNHLKQLIGKVKMKISDRGMEVTDDTIINSLIGFFNSIEDKWMLEHLELKNINSNFNSLYVKALNKSVFGRSEQINDLIRNKYGAGSK